MAKYGVFSKRRAVHAGGAGRDAHLQRAVGVDARDAAFVWHADASDEPSLRLRADCGPAAAIRAVPAAAGSGDGALRRVHRRGDGVDAAVGDGGLSPADPDAGRRGVSPGGWHRLPGPFGFPVRAGRCVGEDGCADVQASPGAGQDVLRRHARPVGPRGVVRAAAPRRGRPRRDRPGRLPRRVVRRIGPAASARPPQELLPLGGDIGSSSCEWTRRSAPLPQGPSRWGRPVPG